jgi:hypothetical protein
MHVKAKDTYIHTYIVNGKKWKRKTNADLSVFSSGLGSIKTK